LFWAPHRGFEGSPTGPSCPDLKTCCVLLYAWILYRFYDLLGLTYADPVLVHHLAGNRPDESNPFAGDGDANLNLQFAAPK